VALEKAIENSMFMNKYKWSRIILFALFCFITYQGYPQEIILSFDRKLPINITTSIEIFRDSSARLSLAQAITKNYQKSTKDHFVFPYTNDTFWVRFKLKNTNAHPKNWFLMWGNPLVEQLDFYISDSTNRRFLHKQQKILTREKERKMIDQEPKFAFELGPQQTKTVYIKLTSKRGHYGNLRIHSEESYYKSRLDDYASQSFFNGLVFFRLFLVVSLSLFVIKDLPFRLYSLHTVIKTFAFWGYLNIAGPWFTDDPDLAKKIDFVFYNSVTIGAGIFVYFTQIRGRLPKIHSIVALTIILVTLFESVIIFVDYQWYWLKMGVYSIIVSAVYFSVLYIYCIAKKITVEKYYAIPFILGLLSYALLYIRLLGWIEYGPLYSIAYLLFLSEIFVFVIFLGRIFRNTEQNKRLAEQKLTFNLEQSARLKELDTLKTTFFANISHEFRTPLTLILSPLNDLQREFPKREIFRIMQQNAERLLALINQLLDLSKLEAGKMTVEIQRADLSQFLRQLLASFESFAQSKSIVFQYEQSHPTRIDYFDADKLEKIVTNLLSNAFKFTPEKGRIEVRVDYTERDCIIKIKDSGIGIAAERLPVIFDRFYQADQGTNRNFEGTGIGLALVKELVDVLRGRIEVQSELGKGSTFVVTLPCDAATWSQYLNKNEPVRVVGKTVIFEQPVEYQVDSSVLEEVVAAEAGLDLPILLIVEDNPDLRQYVRGIFDKRYQVEEAQDGEEGLRKAFELVPDIVICDLMMPRLNGFGFCQVLKTDLRTNHIPVVMLTAKATLEDRLEGLTLGADDYLAKPFSSNELQIRVQNLLQQRRVLQQKYGQNGVLTTPPLVAVKEPSMDDVFLGKALKVVERYISDSSFDVETFAGAMSMTSVQLRRKLKALTDQTVTVFVRNYRLEKAADLLRSRAGTVSDIAYQVGFESLPYFSKVFQERFGKAPSEWH
jgi:signal transduction histidine kinase/CheY-like chemotaxis protein